MSSFPGTALINYHMVIPLATMWSPPSGLTSSKTLCAFFSRWQTYLHRACHIFWSCLGPGTWEDKLGMLCPTDPAIQDSGQGINFSNAAFTWAWGGRWFQLLSLLWITVCSVFSWWLEPIAPSVERGGRPECTFNSPLPQEHILVFGGCTKAVDPFPIFLGGAPGALGACLAYILGSVPADPAAPYSWSSETAFLLNHYLSIDAPLLAKWNIFLTVY